MKKRKIFVCEACGTQFFQWQGQCPICKQWGKIKESVQGDDKQRITKAKFYPLDSIVSDKDFFVSSGSKIFDTFLGQGFMPGSVILLGGEPGIGKSTLLLQLLSSFSKQGKNSLYISGEESLEQIKQRADRLGVKNKNLFIANANTLDSLLNFMDSLEEGTLISIDSIQTMIDPEIDGIAGSVSQVKSVSSRLIEEAKMRKHILFLVSHVTKEGQIAGPKLMEHMVDVVLYLEGDKQYQFRVLRSVKNRYGSSSNILVLNMSDKGLQIVNDPTTFFLKTRDPLSSGSAIVMTVEGQWAFAIEIQALVIKTSLSFPRRTALGFDINRLHLLLAILEKKLNITFFDRDVYVKIGGGMRLKDPGLDLGIVMAILSSYFDKPVPERAIFWGEVDLNGQVRSTIKEDIRLLNAYQLKYNPIVFPATEKKDQNKGLFPLVNISHLIDMLNTW